MQRPGPSSSYNENPHGAYTQDRQNWDNDLERQQRAAQEREDAHHRQMMADQARQQREAQASSRRRAETRPSAANAKRSTASRKAQAQPAVAASPAAADETPFSGFFFLVAAIAAGIWAHGRLELEGEALWFATGFAALIAGGLAGRFYRVIIGLGVVAAVGYGFVLYQQSQGG